MASIDKFLDRRATDTYNCLDFVTEVWQYLFGDDRRKELERLCEAARDGDVDATALRAFRRLQRPSDPCLVVIQRVLPTPHIGIYLTGRVLHLHEGGVAFLPLNVIEKCFNMKARFYR